MSDGKLRDLERRLANDECVRPAFAAELKRTGRTVKASRQYGLLLSKNSNNLELMNNYISVNGISKGKNGFLFRGLPHFNDCIDVCFTESLQCYMVGNLADDKIFYGPFNPDSRLFFSLAHRLYVLRELGDACVADCTDFIRRSLDSAGSNLALVLATSVAYLGGRDVLVEHKTPAGSITPISVKVQEFPGFRSVPNLNAVILKSRYLDESTYVPITADPLLEALFGKYYKCAGDVLQYFACEREGELPNIVLVVPNLENRSGSTNLHIGRFSHFNFGIFAVPDED